MGQVHALDRRLPAAASLGLLGLLLSLLLSVLLAAPAVPAAAATPAGGTEVTGVLERYVVDEPDGSGHELDVVVAADGTRTELPQRALERVAAGSHVRLRVTGLTPVASRADRPVRRATAVTAAEVTALPSPGSDQAVQTLPSETAAVVTSRRVIVVPVYWGASAPTSAPKAAAAVAAADSYWNDVSGGLVRFTVTESRPWTYVAVPGGCQDTAGLASAVGALLGNWRSRADHLLISFADTRCGWAGLAQIGSMSSTGLTLWINRYDRADVYSHELGHNLGLYHSNLWRCTAANGAEQVESGTCSSESYMDFLDVMGIGHNHTGHLSAGHLQRIGLVPGGGMLTAVGGEDLTLAPVSSGSGVRALRLLDSGKTYYVEYRTAVGRDAWLGSSPYPDWRPGLYVTRVDSGRGETQLLDLRPGTTGHDLPVGASWSSASGAWTVSLAGTSAAGARVTVAPTLDVFRLSGSDRYATAAAVSAHSFSPGVPVVYVATGQGFADALGAGPAAARLGGPVLTVTRDAIPASVAAELTRLAPGRIVVVGGPSVVSDAVAQALAGFTTGAVTRASGADRYATGAAVVRSAFTGPVPVAYVATGTGYADALSGGAAAAHDGAPVLLTDPRALSGPTAEVLAELQPARIVVLGGTGAVSEAVRTALGAYTTGPVTRISGADRYATAAAVALQVFGTSATTYVATGTNYPDALAAAPAAHADSAPLLLAAGTCVTAATRDARLALGVTQAGALGGTSVVSDRAARFAPCS